ncbi:MAG: 1-acyl-sn-glycerol-3-phosphate acyltransferase, partial [Rubricoccaceae bacterium]|nr:1-acyl-sn-glycerol-3-phosphate acyltransferase [Rubricoccaceae bacterium]
YRTLSAFVRFVMDVFFREVAVEGKEHVPADRGGLLVAWHPNGLIDPALILAHFPGRIVFGARDGLLRWPIIGWMMRIIGTVPIYRASDKTALSEEERSEANRRSLGALAKELNDGSFSALFPEGLSHDNPHLSPLKTGAARLYYLARELNQTDKPPVIIPVGLHYDRKHIFRSSVLVTFHEPMELPAELDIDPNASESEQAQRDRVEQLTEGIEKTLIKVVRATDGWELHRLMHRARTLIRAEHEARFGTPLDQSSVINRNLLFAQIWHGYQARRASHPEAIERLRHIVDRYDRILKTLRLSDEHLDTDSKLTSPIYFVLVLLRAFAVYVLLPPFLAFGFVVNAPVHFLIKWAARRYSTADKDTATVKILAGFVLYPLAWLVAAVLAILLHDRLHLLFPAIPDTPVLIGLLTLALAIVSGILVLNYSLLEKRTRDALRTRLTRRQRRTSVERLLKLRAEIFDQLMALKEGLALPDNVTDVLD